MPCKRTIRADRASWVLDCRRGVLGSRASLDSLLVRKRSPGSLVGCPRVLCGHTRRTHALRHCYPASEGAAALVRVGTHHHPSDNGILGRPRGDTVRATVAGARVRALVAEGYGSSTAFPRQLGT